jgi:hypothetical protein
LKKEYGFADDNRMTAELDEEISNLNLNRAEEDPYLNLGFGIVAWFRMLRIMIVCFIVLSICAIPSTMIYYKHDGMSNSRNYLKS